MQFLHAIQKNLSVIRAEIAAACGRCNRDPHSVRLVAVTKYATWEWVEALATVHDVFGEARPQQLAERQPALPDAEWHLIGQLQRNKVRSTLHHAALIHSVDSLKLLDRIATVAEEMDLQPSVLLQVNVSGEGSKSGFSPASLQADWPDVCDLARRVGIRGLMTMAPASDDPEEARPTFRGLRKLRDALADRAETLSGGLAIVDLSMGMSGDFVVAIEEGATLIRVGSRLFEGLS